MPSIPVTCSYKKNGQVICVGEGISITLTIADKEIRNLYFGKPGKASLSIEKE
jgi:hypothetical protein